MAGWLPPTACSQKAHHSMVAVLAMACDLYSSSQTDTQKISIQHINTWSQISPTPPSGDGEKALICQARQKGWILPTHPRSKVNLMEKFQGPGPKSACLSHQTWISYKHWKSLTCPWHIVCLCLLRQMLTHAYLSAVLLFTTGSMDKLLERALTWLNGSISQHLSST